MKNIARSRENEFVRDTRTGFCGGRVRREEADEKTKMPRNEKVKGRAPAYIRGG